MTEKNAKIDDLMKERRKSNRRSSLIASDALKQMNMDITSFNEQSLSEFEYFDRITELGLKWLEKKLEDLKSKASVASKLVNKTNASLVSNINVSVNKGQNDYEMLSDEQKQFLKSVTISEEDIIRILKNKHKELIKLELEEMDKNAKNYSKKSCLLNVRTSTFKMQPLESIDTEINENYEDPIGRIAWDYFNS